MSGAPGTSAIRACTTARTTRWSTRLPRAPRNSAPPAPSTRTAGAAALDPAGHRPGGGVAERHGALLAALAEDPDHVAVEVDVVHVEAAAARRPGCRWRRAAPGSPRRGCPTGLPSSASAAAASTRLRASSCAEHLGQRAAAPWASRAARRRRSAARPLRSQPAGEHPGRGRPAAPAWCGSGRRSAAGPASSAASAGRARAGSVSPSRCAVVEQGRDVAEVGAHRVRRQVALGRPGAARSRPAPGPSAPAAHPPARRAPRPVASPPPRWRSRVGGHASSVGRRHPQPADPCVVARRAVRSCEPNRARSAVSGRRRSESPPGVGTLDEAAPVQAAEHPLHLDQPDASGAGDGVGRRRAGAPAPRRGPAPREGAARRGRASAPRSSVTRCSPARPTSSATSAPRVTRLAPVRSSWWTPCDWRAGDRTRDAHQRSAQPLRPVRGVQRAAARRRPPRSRCRGRGRRSAGCGSGTGAGSASSPAPARRRPRRAAARWSSSALCATG